MIDVVMWFSMGERRFTSPRWKDVPARQGYCCKRVRT